MGQNVTYGLDCFVRIVFHFRFPFSFYCFVNRLYYYYNHSVAQCNKKKQKKLNCPTDCEFVSMYLCFAIGFAIGGTICALVYEHIIVAVCVIIAISVIGESSSTSNENGDCYDCGDYVFHCLNSFMCVRNHT